MVGEVITKEKHPDIYKWLSENIESYENKMEYFTLTSEGKINAYCSVYLQTYTKQIKYPFGYVSGTFDCSGCENLTSLKGSPKDIGRDFCFNGCMLTSFIDFPKHVNGNIFFNANPFSNNPNKSIRYNLYVNMWVELLESVSEDDRWEYINNYQNKVDIPYNKPIIPKEVIDKYKIDFLLK